MARKLMKGCEALGEAAIQAGCTHFFGYPITPQTEVPEYLSKRLPEIGGVYVQAESEVAASNMIYGAAGAGVRVFTSSSSPGISLMAEGISYIAGAELPVVIINIMRAGPGLGGILPSQGDYFQATKGGGHGDYHTMVLAPSTIQESVDLMMLAFDLADKYRNPVMVVADGIIGQMMEPVEFKERPKIDLPPKDWATTGAKNRRPNIINSLYLDPNEMEQLNDRLADKYQRMAKEEILYESYRCDREYDLLVVAYGTMARISKTTISMLEDKGISVGLLRPITLFPYPYDAVHDAAQKARMVLCAELSKGQMIEDVRLGLKNTRPVHFFGRTGGIVPPPEELFDMIIGLLERQGGV
ncbi:3-methyl-2-oxobutanoate dehydrogenase subunit VorB [bacterium]|nr:3-methyl-2-oxobutanoate dehydrogenase subunit VorB [candidate division CSSED10-310 bacterium]